MLKTLLTVAAFSLILSAAAPLIAQDKSETVGDIPVPFYTSHVTKRERISDGSVVIKTTDSKDTVVAWYKAHLKDQAGGKDFGATHHIFNTHNGATVAVSTGDPASHDTATRIGLVWNSQKYGAYPK